MRIVADRPLVAAPLHRRALAGRPGAEHGDLAGLIESLHEQRRQLALDDADPNPHSRSSALRGVGTGRSAERAPADLQRTERSRRRASKTREPRKTSL